MTCGRLPVVSWKFRGTFLKIEPSLDCKARRFGTGLYKASKTPYSITLTHSLSSAPVLRQTAPPVVKSESHMYWLAIERFLPPFSFFDFFICRALFLMCYQMTLFVTVCAFKAISFSLCQPILLLLLLFFHGLLTKSFHPPPPDLITVQSWRQFLRTRPKAPIYPYLFTFTDCKTQISAEILKVENKQSAGDIFELVCKRSFKRHWCFVFHLWVLHLSRRVGRKHWRTFDSHYTASVCSLALE